MTPIACAAAGLQVSIVVLRGPSDIAGLRIDPGLGAFFGYRPGWTEMVRSSLDKVLRAPGAEVFGAVRDGVLIGYLILAPADPDQPWGRLRDPRVIDTAIEVARGQRGRGVALALFRHAFERPEIESRIFVATGYVWCWDMDGAEVGASVYADRLLRLFERFGFRREWTSEPTIQLSPFNFLAVRVGRLVPASLVRRVRRAAQGLRAA